MSYYTSEQRLELHNLVEVSNNYRLTGDVLNMLKEKLSPDEMITFNQWLLVIKRVYKKKLKMIKKFKEFETIQENSTVNNKKVYQLIEDCLIGKKINFYEYQYNDVDSEEKYNEMGFSDTKDIVVGEIISINWLLFRGEKNSQHLNTKDAFPVTVKLDNGKTIDEDVLLTDDLTNQN